MAKNILELRNGNGIDASVERILRDKFKNTASIKGKLSQKQQETAINAIKYRMAKSIPEAILSQLATTGEVDFDTIARNNPTNYNVWSPQGFGNASEKIFMGITGAGSPFADAPLSIILQDFEKRIEKARGNPALEKSLSEEKARIQAIVKSEYFGALMKDIPGLQLEGSGALISEADIGFEMKAYGQADYLKGGQFTLSNGKSENDILIEAIAKFYSKMSMLFLMSIQYQAAFKTATANRTLIINGASIFHELIFDRVLQGINFGLIEVSMKERVRNDNKTTYEVGINFLRLNEFYQGVFGQAIQRANDVVLATRQSGLYRHEIRLWDDFGATRQEYFFSILQLLRKTGLLDKGTALDRR